MKIFLSIAFILAIRCIPAGAQIVVTSESFKALTGTEMKSVDQTIIDANINDKLLAIAAQSGTGQTWDLSTFNYEPGDTLISILIEGTTQAPTTNDPRLQKANYLMKYSFPSIPEQADWVFLSISDTDLLEHGVITGPESERQTFVFDPPLKVIEFPFSFGSYWKDTMSLVFDTTLPFTFHQEITSAVDGEGILKMPGGISLPCLRVKQVQIASDDFGFFHDTSTSYSFIDANGYSLASLSLNHAGIIASYHSTAKVAVQQPIIFSSVDYSEPSANKIVLTVSPNPAVKTVTIRYEPVVSGLIEFTLSNAAGIVLYRRAKHVGASEQQETFDVSSLPAGIYLVHLEYSVGTAYTKVIVSP